MNALSNFTDRLLLSRKDVKFWSNRLSTFFISGPYTLILQERLHWVFLTVHCGSFDRSFLISEPSTFSLLDCPFRAFWSVHNEFFDRVLSVFWVVHFHPLVMSGFVAFYRPCFVFLSIQFNTWSSTFSFLTVQFNHVDLLLWSNTVHFERDLLDA